MADENVPIDHLDQPSTHASRHPEKKCIPPRANYRKKSAAERATSNLQRALRKERKEGLENEVKAFVEQRDILAKELAERYNQKVEKMRRTLSGALLVQQKRRPNIWNALVARRGQQLNEGEPEGDRLTLKEIQETVQEEIEEGKHEDVDKEELLKELEDARELKLTGARSSNRAAAVDYNAALRRVEAELGNLHERCGTMAFAFFTRGHVHDSIVPGWIESQGSLAFLSEVLEITPAEVVRKFELWACAKDRTKRLDTLATLRSECVNMIGGGLHKLLGTSNVTMCYEKYETNIVEQHGVALRGWPEGLQMRSPARITTMEDARVLRDALLSGECIWVKLTRQEKEARAKARQEKIASGQLPVKKRKERSDKGKTRGLNKSKAGDKRKRRQGKENDGEQSEDGNDDEDQRHKKKQRRSHAGKRGVASQMPPMPKSKEFVDDSDEESD